MKKVFVISLPGAENKMIVADSQEDAFERRGEVEPSYEYLPVTVSELQIEGFDIHAKPKQEEKPEPVEVPKEPEPETPEIPVEKPPEKPKQKKKPTKK